MVRILRYAILFSFVALVVACGRSTNLSDDDSFSNEFSVDSSTMSSGTNPRRSQTLRQPHRTSPIPDFSSSADWICGGLYDNEYWGLSSFCYATAGLFDMRPDVGWTMWLQLHNYRVETAPAAGYVPPTCVKFTVTITEENKLTLGLLRSITADWNHSGAMPTRTRSGTNQSVLTLTYELKDADQANLYIGSLVPTGKQSKLKLRYQVAACAGSTVTAADVTVPSTTMATRLNNRDGQIEYLPKDISSQASAELYLIERPTMQWWF